MDENFKLFYRTLEPEKFKYFVKEGFYYVYNTDIDYLPASTKPKNDKVIRLQNIEQIVKDLLVNKKVAVEEYTYFKNEASIGQEQSCKPNFFLEESNKNLSSTPNGCTYKLTKKGFPSDYLDFLDLCITESIPPTIFAISIVNSNNVSVAFIKDLKIMECEFTDDDLFSSLYSLACSYNCIEFLFCNKIMEKVFNAWGVSCLFVKFNSCADAIKTYMKVDLPCCKFIKEDCCLLNILDFDLVDFGCVTQQGKRLINQWLRSPSTNIEEINQRLDLSECFKDISININRFQDLKKISSKIYNRAITINECVKLCETIEQVPELIESFKIFINQSRVSSNEDVMTDSPMNCYKRNNELNNSIENRSFASEKDRIFCKTENIDNFEQGSANKSIFSGFNDFNTLNQFQRNTIASNKKCELIINRFIVPLENLKFIFDPLLVEMKNKINFKASRIYSHLSDQLTALEKEKHEIYKEIETEFLKVKKDFSKLSFANRMFKISRLEYNQNNFDNKKYQIVSLLKNGAHFVTKNLSEMNENLEKIEREIVTAESLIFDQIKNNLIEYITSIESLNFLISLIDVYKAFSMKVNSGNYTRPIFSEDKYNVLGMFHPLLEHKSVILNDICFDKDLCVLTGPNMGGKSTFLKTLSMVSLYAQLGCYVPAKKAILPIFDRIFLRIGARDCSSQRMSTFMVEMTDLNKILRTGTSKSLILIDELGRGTSAIDGLSLVLAVKEYLISLKAKTVIATHFSQVGDERTLNKKMSVADNVLTYKIEDGFCDTSFGIKVAEMAGFPPSVLEKAKEYVKIGKN